MKKKRLITTLIIAFGFGTLGLAACKNATVIYSGKFNNQEYSLISIETKGPSTNSIDYELKLGKLPPVLIDAISTDTGIPYSPDIFNGAYIPISVPQTAYLNVPNYDSPNGTALYFSEEIFSKEEFNQYKEMMLSEWPAIDKKFVEKSSSLQRITGIVYGEDEKFTLKFTGKYENKPYLLTVEPDGVIKFYPDDDKRNYEYSGLSQKVQMPDRSVLLKTGKDARLSAKDLLIFKNDQGKTLIDYFKIKEN